MMPIESAKRILIVDDESSIRRMLHTALTQRGLSVDEAEDGRKALELLHANKYAVVLLDLFMPNFDGFLVLDSMQGDEVQGPPIVLVVTGADRSTIEQLDSRRIHGVIRKPFDIEDLGALVAACSEIKSRNAFGTMAIATVLSGAGMLHWLVK